MYVAKSFWAKLQSQAGQVDESADCPIPTFFVVSSHSRISANSREFDFFNSGNSEVVVFVSKMPRSSGYSYHAPGAGANMGNGGPDVDVKVKRDNFLRRNGSVSVAVVVDVVYSFMVSLLLLLVHWLFLL